jgi:pSer/pThr/pTyr-binding forkhead associated (FHA) protein
MIRFAGCVGIVLGVLILLLCIANILIAPQVEALTLELPIVGDWIMDVMRQLTYFPNAQYAFFLLGMFSIFWGVSLIRKQSWARIVGAVLNGLAALYTLALLLVVFWLDEVSRVRWWIALIALLIAFYFVYMAYYLLLKKETQWAFAEQYYRRHDFDLPPRSKKVPDASSTAKPLSQKQTLPELARLVPAGREGQPFVMKEQRITIGRERTHLILDPLDTSISRQHATIYLVGEQFILEDKSRNGTTVNGQCIKNDKLTLSDGAEILFGRHAKFIFKRAPGKKPPPQESTGNEAPVVLARLEPLWPEGKPFDIVKPKVIIGRDPAECDLALPSQEDLTISGKHAEFEGTDQGKFILRDLSSNGTYVDNARISEIELTDGAEIRLGLKNTRFRFQKG